MDFKTFQEGALRTESPGVPYDTQMQAGALVVQVLHLLNRIRFVGEDANIYKRHLYYGKPLPMPCTGPGCAEHVEQAVLNPTFKRLLHAVLGKASEIAEMAEILEWMVQENGGNLRATPTFGEGQQVTAETLRYTAHHMGEEFGDDQWYGAILADAAGFDPDAALGRVLDKLRERYPDKFTEEAAGKRDLDAEARAVAGVGA